MTEHSPVTVATVVPYQGGHAGLAVHSGGALIASESFELGRVRCRAHGKVDCPPCSEEQARRVAAKVRSADRTMFRRDVEPADMDAVACAIGERIASHGVQRVDIEAAAETGEAGLRGGMVASALRDALPSGVRVETIARLPHRTKGGAVGDAAALANVTAPAPAVPPATTVPVEVPAGPYEVPSHPPVVEVLPPVLARRVAGIDPGSRRVAVVVGEGDVPPLRMVAAKVFTLEGGKVPVDADVERLIGDVLAFLAKYGVERVAVERATHLQGGAGEYGRVAALLRAAHVGGELAGAVRAWLAKAGSVVTCSSAEWRRSACDEAGLPMREERSEKGKRLPRDHRTAVRALFVGEVPSGAGDHALDAAGAALWAARAPKVERPKVERAPGAPRPSKHAKRNEARRAAALAAGCSGCVGRHKAPCPIAVAANEKRSANMQGNRNRARGAEAVEVAPVEPAPPAPALSPAQLAAAEGKRLPVGTVRVPPA